jgi:nitrogen fixation/metabolism regulation signal transduction histidine kinase
MQNIDDARQFALLVANSVDSAIVMKNIQIQEINTTTQPVQSVDDASKTPLSLLLYLYGLMALVIAVFVAPIIHVAAKHYRLKNRTNRGLVSFKCTRI